MRKLLSEFYETSRSLDQAWKTCKGSLYEYAVFSCLDHIIKNDPNLCKRFEILVGDDALASAWRSNSDQELE